jgi:hypothetical protein
MAATMVGMGIRWPRGPLVAVAPATVLAVGCPLLAMVLALSGCAPDAPRPQRSGAASEALAAAGTGAAAAVPEPAPAGHQERRPRTVRSLAVLHRWDTARASAYASGDVERLRRLYATGSGAAAADVRVLRRYTARGLVITGMRRQVLEAQVRHWSGHRLVLRLTDRLVGAVAVGGATRTPLPTAGFHRWLLELRREDRRWVLSRIEEP